MYIAMTQIQQWHFMEEKAKADINDLVTRTSDHKALQVNVYMMGQMSVISGGFHIECLDIPL